MTKRKKLIRATVRVMVSNLLYYDRKEDVALPVGAIEEAIEAGEISLDGLVGMFRSELLEAIPGKEDQG